MTTIDDYVKAKRASEQAILEVLRGFQRATGLEVRALMVDTSGRQTMGDGNDQIAVVTAVQIDARLP